MTLCAGSPPGDLEEGEIEDGELPDDEGDTNPSKHKVQSSVSLVTHRSSTSTDKSMDRFDKSNESRMSRRKNLIHHHSDRSNEEEEWACVVEKKLKAAMGKDVNDDKVCASPERNSTEKPVPVEEDRKSRPKDRKRKKKYDERKDDRKDSKKRKRNHHWNGDEERAPKEKVKEGENVDDDDEMVFVRGASPVLKENFDDDDDEEEEKNPSPKYPKKEFQFTPKEESDFDAAREDFGRNNPPLSDDEGPKRGMGRGSKRRPRSAVGRIITPSKRPPRKDTKTKRGGIKRPHSSRSNSDRDVCMFFMQGKCQKGDDCPYSHNVCPPRKMELCKFYLMDCCAKKDKCLYMHNEFPCKYFHTGLKCFSGPRCKFSHGHLSDTMRSILLKGSEGNRHNEQRMSNRSSVPSQEHRSKHLETAPKDLLGDFPRLSREGGAAMVYNKKNRSSKGKKIPSLFDIEVPIPAQLLAEQKESSKDQSPRRTPMPDSDNEDHDGTTTPMPQSPISDGKPKGKSQRWGSEDAHCSHPREPKDEEVSTSPRDEEKKPLVPNFYKETENDTGNKKNSDKDRGKLNLHRFAGYSPTPVDEKRGSLDQISSEKSPGEQKEVKRKLEEKKTQNDASNEYGVESNDPANIPLHLPKKQRELFLRIQQQQREAENSQDQGSDHKENDDDIAEENWYSSDEEEESLTNVLKNLSKQDQEQTSQPEINVKSQSGVSRSLTTPSLPIKMSDLSKIKIDETVTKLLSSLCAKNLTSESKVCPPATVTSEQSFPSSAVSAVGRDPRLSRDPRSRTQAAGPITSNGAGAFVAASENVAATASTTLSSQSSSIESSRRSDPRRIHDPRSAKSSHKNDSYDLKHSGSISGRRSSNTSHSSSYPSIYSNAIMSDKAQSSGLGLNLGGANTGDVDLRNFLPRTVETGDVDLRSRNDTDLRTGQPAPALAFGDTDLRVRAHDMLNVGHMDSSRSNSDVDLRMLDLPFKPVPMHTPATEIDASITSHPPIPYKVVVVTIPRPDYTSLKLNTSDPQVQSDPRLRKIFKLQSPDTPARPSSVSRNDPRRHSSKSGNSSSGANSSINPHSSNSNIITTSGCSSSTYTVSNSHVSTNANLNMSIPEHLEMSEPFQGPLPTTMISKSGNDVSNMGSMLMPNPATHVPIGAPVSSPLLPNPHVRIGRDPRNAPGLLGPAPMLPNYLPVFEEQADMSSGMDNGSRVIYGRGSMNGGRWEQQTSASNNMSRGSWRNNRRNP